MMENIFNEHLISNNAYDAWGVFAEDINSDGHMDILSASNHDDKIAWYQNNGNQEFTEHIITTNADVAWSVYAIDLDRDGDIDVLGAAAGTSQDISWWENDGSESFTKRTISGSYPGATSVFALDLDKDGDIDVVSTGAASSGDDVTWWENDGTPSNGGWTEHTIDPDLEEAWYVRAADFDEDGDIDVVAAGKGAGGTTGKIKWYINDGSPDDDDWTAVLIDSNIYGAMCVRAVDMDLDGDLDGFIKAYLMEFGGETKDD